MDFYKLANELAKNEGGEIKEMPKTDYNCFRLESAPIVISKRSYFARQIMFGLRQTPQSSLTNEPRGEDAITTDDSWSIFRVRACELIRATFPEGEEADDTWYSFSLQFVAPKVSEILEFEDWIAQNKPQLEKLDAGLEVLFKEVRERCARNEELKKIEREVMTAGNAAMEHFTRQAKLRLDYEAKFLELQKALREKVYALVSAGLQDDEFLEEHRNKLSVKAFELFKSKLHSFIPEVGQVFKNDWVNLRD